MTAYQLKESDVRSILDQLIVTEADSSILFSALEKQGSFNITVQYFLLSIEPNRSLLLVFDGSRIYPVGQGLNIPFRNFPVVVLPNFTGIMGNSEMCGELLAISKSEIAVKPKEFRILHRPQEIPLVSSLEMKFVESDTELRELCQLRAEFAFDDSGTVGDPKKIYEQLRSSYKNFLPAILRENGLAIGMVNSHYRSNEVSMINMVYLKQQFRGSGRARNMMIWYQNELFKKTKAIVLFHTPENIPAQRLYESLGYINIDDWVINS